MSYNYQSITSHDESGDGLLGKAWFSTNYQLNVAFTGNMIGIEQHLQVYLSADGTFGIGNSYNPIDKTIADTYTLSVDESGGLAITLSATSAVDNSEKPNLNWFKNFLSSDMNQLCTQIQQWLDAFVGSQLTDVPVSTMQNFIFHGGKVFTYANVSFSDNGDLVCYITYTDPQ